MADTDKRDVVVVEDGDGSSSVFGMVVGLIAVLALVLVLVFALGGESGGEGDGGGVEVPTTITSSEG